MPCLEPASNIVISLSADGRLAKFRFVNRGCTRELASIESLHRYYDGKTLDDVIKTDFSKLTADLKVADEEEQFKLYLEWDILRTAAAKYLGITKIAEEDIDQDRCHIVSLTQTTQGVEIVETVLPPIDFPKIVRHD
ncbi:MAG: iron-sulfur cluster assembly scaffold protein [Candidatus Omnitrophota bacterium]